MLSGKKISHYFSLAHNACQFSDNGKTKLGCVLIYHGNVLTVGWNTKDKEHPLQKELNAYRDYNYGSGKRTDSIHAEMMAMIKARNLDVNFAKVSLFVVRVKKDGSFGMARPCAACEAMIRRLGIVNVYYTTDSGWGYERFT